MREFLKEIATNCFRDLWKAPLWAKAVFLGFWLAFCLYGLRGAGLCMFHAGRVYDKMTWNKIECTESDTLAHKGNFEYLRNPIHFYQDK